MTAIPAVLRTPMAHRRDTSIHRNQPAKPSALTPLAVI
jgi:hypothetical protein